MFRKLKNEIGDFLQAQGIKIIQKRIVKGWGFADYFDDIFIPPIKKFCEVMLEEEYILKYNSKKKNVFEETLRLINQADYDEPSFTIDEMKRREVREYIIKNIGYYWS